MATARCCCWCATSRAQTRLETMRKDFVANASHELRSPLTVIAGYLETLATDPDLGLDLRPPILEMRRQAERMTTIIRDLLELSRLEASDEQVEGAPVDMAGLLATLRKDVLARAQHPAEVRVAIDIRCLPGRRRRPAAFGVRQPGRQRGQVHARRGQCRAALVERRERRTFLGDATPARHPARAPAAPDRALLPGRPRPLARDRRVRPRARDRQARAAAPWRRTRGRRARRARAARSPAIFRRGACSRAGAMRISA